MRDLPPYFTRLFADGSFLLRYERMAKVVSQVVFFCETFFGFFFACARDRPDLFVGDKFTFTTKRKGIQLFLCPRLL